MFKNEDTELSEKLNYRGVQLKLHDLESVRRELMDGLGLSAEFSADWTARYLNGNEHLKDGWAQELRKDIKQFAHDYIGAFMKEKGIRYRLLPYLYCRNQPQQAWEDHADFIGRFIGEEADKYLMKCEDVYDIGGYNGNTEPGDVYDLAYDLLNSTRAVFEREALGGNIEDFRKFCGSPDDNNILNTAVRLDCTEDMISFVGTKGTLDDMQNIMAGYLTDNDSQLLYDSVQNGTFSGMFDTEFIDNAFEDIRYDYAFNDDDKETLYTLIIEGMILNPDFVDGINDIKNAIANDRFHEYNVQDAIEWYQKVMVTDDLPNDTKINSDNLFDRLLHEAN